MSHFSCYAQRQGTAWPGTAIIFTGCVCCWTEPRNCNWFNRAKVMLPYNSNARIKTTRNERHLIASQCAWNPRRGLAATATLGHLCLRRTWSSYYCTQCTRTINKCFHLKKGAKEETNCRWVCEKWLRYRLCSLTLVSNGRTNERGQTNGLLLLLLLLHSLTLVDGSTLSSNLLLINTRQGILKVAVSTI